MALGRIVCIATGVFLACAQSAMAEDLLGLKEAVDLALKQNHLLLATQSERDAAEAGLKSTRSRYLPRLILEERAVMTDSATRAFMMKLDEGRFTLDGDLNNPETTSDFQTSVSLEQPLFDLSLARGVDGAAAESQARSHSVAMQREDVAFKVYAAYLNVQRNRASLQVAVQALKDAAEQKRVAAVRTAEGTGLKYDELRIGTHMAELEQQKITIENDLRLARLRLGLLLGMPAGSAPDISETVSAVEITTSTEALLQLSLMNRSDLKEMTAELERAEAHVGAASGSYWPTLYAVGTYQMNDRDIPFGQENDSWMVGAVLRWEIFDGQRRTGEVEKARAMRNARSSRLHALRQEIALEINDSVVRVRESEKRLLVARNAMSDAEEMVRLINRRFENDLATAVELLDAQTALNRARGQLAENEATYALTAAKVYYNAGLFMKEVVK